MLFLCSPRIIIGSQLMHSFITMYIYELDFVLLSVIVLISAKKKKRKEYMEKFNQKKTDSIQLIYIGIYKYFLLYSIHNFSHFHSGQLTITKLPIEKKIEHFYSGVRNEIEKKNNFKFIHIFTHTHKYVWHTNMFSRKANWMISEISQTNDFLANLVSFKLSVIYIVQPLIFSNFSQIESVQR